MTWTPPAIVRSNATVRLYDLKSGKEFASFGGHDIIEQWSIICSLVADCYECSEDDVDCIETEEGDRITANGVPVAYKN